MGNGTTPDEPHQTKFRLRLDACLVLRQHAADDVREWPEQPLEGLSVQSKDSAILDRLDCRGTSSTH